MTGLLFWIYFYYKTQILNIDLFSSFSLVSNVYALGKEISSDQIHTIEKNSILDRVEKSSLYKMAPLYKNDYFEILPKYDFSGLNLYFYIEQGQLVKSIAGLKKDWGSCLIKDPFIFTLSMALIERQIAIKHEKKYGPLLDIISDCKNKIPKSYSNILHVISSKGSLDKNILLTGMPKEELETVERIKKLRNEREKKYKEIYKFLKLTEDYIVRSSTFSPSEIFDKYKQYKNEPSQSIYFKALSQIILSLQVKNIGWNIGNVEKFATLDPELVIFESPSLPVWSQIFADLKIENFDIEAMIMMIHDKIEGHFDFQLRPDIKRIFALSVFGLTHVNQDKLIEKESLNFSSAELKILLSSPTLGKSLPGLWIYYLFLKEEKTALVKFLDSMNTSSFWKFINDDNFWAVAPLLISPEKIDDFNNKYLIKYSKNIDSYHKHLFIKLIEKEYYKRLLYLLDEKGAWNRAKFQIMRDFYKENMASGMAIDYSFYHLYKLGDVNPINLWWMVL